MRGSYCVPILRSRDIRRHCAGQLATLPDQLKRLQGHGEYPVAVSPGLRARQERALAEVGAPRPG